MLNKLLFCGAALAAFVAPLAFGSTVSFNVTETGSFSGGALDNLTLPSGDKSFSATFTSNYTSNQNVTASPTFYGAPGVALQQAGALGKFVFTDSTSSPSGTFTGPVDLNMNVNVGGSTATLTFIGNLQGAVVNGVNVLDVNYSASSGQFTQTLYDSAYGVSGTYVMQYFDGYEFGVLSSTLAESAVIDSGKQVGIDGAVASAPEPATVYTLGFAGAGLVLIGFKKRKGHGCVPPDERGTR
ncbi:MAG: hypothetical protein WA324_24960 [Bryobacteraceae bacterium]